jgi:DNA polymerase
MFSIAKDDEPPVLWDFLNPNGDESQKAWTRLYSAVEDGSLLSSFNVMFELAISSYRLQTDVGIACPSVEQLRCTRAKALRATIPASLAKASVFLNLGVDKDASGKALIGIFSDQTKLVTLKHGKETMKSYNPILEQEIPWDWTLTVAGETITVRQAWGMFKAYCRKDVEVEREVDKALAKYDLTGSELDGFLFDLRMNMRGIPVNVPALEHADKLLNIEQKHLTSEFEKLTGLQPTQTAKVLEWLQHRGYAESNLQAATMNAQLGSSFLTPEGQRALEIRSSLSFAAVKKIPSMLNTACPDGRMRGLFTWYGAQRTGRWTASGPQPQNAKKPTIKNPDEAYADICSGVDIDTFEILYGSPYEAIASCVRNFIKPHKGKMIDTDLANIESRVAAMIAGQEDMLQAYRDGRDLYKELAMVIFKVALDEVTKDQRFVAKTASLACVFATGPKTFHETCAAWGMPIEKKLACHTVKVWRQENPQFVKSWKHFEAVAVQALDEPEKWHVANEFVSFAYTKGKPFPRLLMKLPGNRNITYPLPKLERALKRHTDYETGETREWESNEITFYGALRGFTGWGRVRTSGPDLFQSSVQGTARDILQHGCVTAEKAGFNIWAVIHDQALADEGDVDLFKSCICSHPDWLPKDFPLASEGFLCDYYAK